MAFPTFLMGCLPTYEQVGALSTVSLVVCRLLQGMSVGGQLPASLIYTVEIRPRKHWGYYGALVMSKSWITPLSEVIHILAISISHIDDILYSQWLQIAEHF
jgi:MFS family permease